MLVFGPLTELPSKEILAELRRVLVSDYRLSNLVHAIKELPRLWRDLTEFDPNLNRVLGAKCLDDLLQWLENGGFSPHHLSMTPNVYSLPVTVILHVLQYSHYLNQLGGEKPHRLVLDGVQAGGIQGFCVGFLSSIAVASSENEGDIGTAAAKALQIAVCIGAYVDAQGTLAEEREHMVCVAIRWKGSVVTEKRIDILVQRYPEVSPLNLSKQMNMH